MTESESRQQQAAEHASSDERRERTVRYFNGEIPFYFDYEFRNGARLLARQSDQGEGSVVIEKNRETVFDAASLLPEGYRMVTPTYLFDHLEQRHSGDYDARGWRWGGWRASYDHKIILLGPMHSAKDLLGLLHEIGHARDHRDHDAFIELQKQLGGVPEELNEKQIALLKAMARLASSEERRAWAFAVTELRGIIEKAGIDIREIFPSLRDLTAYVHEPLSGYRKEYEELSNQQEEIRAELLRLFDRGKGETSGKE